MTHEEFFKQLEKDMQNICINCNKDCPCIKLAKYLNEVGIDAFKEQYYSFKLPSDIYKAFNYYVSLNQIY